MRTWLGAGEVVGAGAQRGSAGSSYWRRPGPAESFRAPQLRVPMVEGLGGRGSLLKPGLLLQPGEDQWFPHQPPPPESQCRVIEGVCLGVLASGQHCMPSPL